MITKEQFSKYEAVLRKLGNNRTAYACFADAKYIKNQPQSKYFAFLRSPIKKVIVMLADDLELKKQLVMQNVEVMTDWEAILDCIMQNKLVVVIGDVQQLKDNFEYSVAFNELLTEDFDDFAGFVSKRIEGGHQYLRQIIDTVRSSAFLPSKTEPAYVGCEPWQPWHVIITFDNSNDILQIVWDTRLIVGAATLTDEELADIQQNRAAANDNSRLLYVHESLANNHEIFTRYLADTIIDN